MNVTGTVVGVQVVTTFSLGGTGIRSKFEWNGGMTLITGASSCLQHRNTYVQKDKDCWRYEEGMRISLVLTKTSSIPRQICRERAEPPVR